MIKPVQISILLPVYGRSDLLGTALSSVLKLKNEKWELIIADDGSDEKTQLFLDQWIKQYGDDRVRWIRREQNIGLFANINSAIKEAFSEWVLLLCSDDLLMPSAVDRIVELRHQWPEAGLILSTFESINADGSAREPVNAWHHDNICKNTSLVEPEVFIPALLQFGSLNGNLTGMAFSQKLWKKAGPFKTNWRHAGDWDWLLRGADVGSLILNRKPIAKVRTHDMQLSNENRVSGHEIQEVAEVVNTLKRHQRLVGCNKRNRWAAHIMQHQLWNLLKQYGVWDIRMVLKGVATIRKASSMRETSLALLAYLPERMKKHLCRSLK
jgi:glycosyltransferase involved in cell wall biosynthesis